MPFRFRAAALAAGVVLASLAAPQARAQALTLGEAWRIAEERNPALRSAAAALHGAQGQLADSRAALWNNPEASLEGSRTRIPQAEERYRGWTLGLAQTFEIAGQQGLRRGAAEADLAAVEAQAAEARVQLRAEVEERFVQVLALQQRADVERETVALVAQAEAAMQKRLDAGEASRLERNLAMVEAERARNQLTQVEERVTQARAELASLLQLPPAELPEVAGELRRAAGYSLEELLSSARRRQRLASLAMREEAARGRLALEQASRYPDLTLGVTAGRDGPPGLRENVLGFAVSLPLPVFRRNDAGVGRAMTELTQAQIERQASERDTLASVRALWLRVGQLEARAGRLRDSVARTLEENRRLSRRAFEEGEIGALELVVVNRQLAELRRDVLEAETELRLARVALERAAGWGADTKGPTK